MRNLIALTVLCFCFQTAFSQEKEDDFNLMIDSSIKMTYRLFKDDSLIHHQTNNYLHKIYLLDKQNRALNYLNDSINHLFKFIDIYDKRNRRLLTKGILVWKVTSTLSGNVLTIRVTDFTVIYKGNRHYYFSTSGGSVTVFEYKSSLSGWKLNSFKYNSI